MAAFPEKFIRFNSAVIASSKRTQQTGYGRNKVFDEKLDDHLWDVEFTIKHLTDFELSELSVFLQENKTFTLRVPRKVYGVDTTSFTSGAGLQGDKSISVSGLTVSNSNCIAVGDYFKFDNHPKVYRCTKTVVSDATGAGTLEFFPPLFNDVPNATGAGTAIFTLRNKSDRVAENLDGSRIFHPFSISTEESP